MRVHAVIINKGIKKEFTYNSVKMMKDDIKDHFRHATVVRYSKVTMNDEYSEPKYLVGTPQDEIDFNEEMKKPVGYKTITELRQMSVDELKAHLYRWNPKKYYMFGETCSKKGDLISLITDNKYLR